MSEPVRAATTSSMRLRAMAGSPEEMSGALVVYQLYTLLRAATMYEPGHPQVTQQARRYAEALRPQFDALGSDQITVVFSGAHIYVNRTAVRADAAEQVRAQWLMQQLGRLRVLEIVFRRNVDEADLSTLCRRFSEACHTQGSIADITDLGGVSLLVAKEDPGFESLLGTLVRLARYPLLQLYAEGLSRTVGWVQALDHGHAPDAIGARRLAGQLVDAYHVDPGGTAGMVVAQPSQGAAARRFHTAIIGVGLALHVGLSDTSALEVGMSALLRPVVEPWANWWERQPVGPQYAAHVAMRSQLPLIAITSYESMAPLGVVAAAECYGEPRFKHLASLILDVSEAYVQLLSPAAPASPFTPEMALQMLIAQAGRAFDADLVSALVSLLGLWPPGSLVQLNSGDLAVVVEPPPVGSDLGRPTVRVVDVLSTQVYPLWKPELQAYSIVRSVARSESPVNPGYVFLR